MQSFVVNLDRCPQRLEHMVHLFSAMNLDFERVPAVDGKQLTKNVVDTYSNGEVPLGAIGCYLSHRKCWEKIAAGKDDFAAIFEDDIYLSTLASKFIGSDNWIPKDADIVKIETIGDRTFIKKRKIVLDGEISLSRLTGKHTATGGYIISRCCAAKLLKTMGRITVEVDQLMFNPRCEFNSDLVIYQMTPAICIQSIIKHKFSKGLPLPDTFVLSYIEGERSPQLQTMNINKGGKRSKGAKLIREVTRPWSQFKRLCKTIYEGTRYISIPFYEETNISDKQLNKKEN